MRLTLITGPIDEPLDVGEVTSYLVIDHDDDNGLIAGLIQSARELVEAVTERQLVTATWRYLLDAFPVGRRPITIPLPPLRTLTSITYLDTDGVEQTWAASKYVVAGNYPTLAPPQAQPATVTPTINEEYPDTGLLEDAVRINFTAGYGSPEDVPEPFKARMRREIASWYEHRELVGQPTVDDRTLDPFTVFTLA